MHECPERGMACDCDGEDTWFDYPYNMDCEHDCDAECDEYGDEWEPEETE